MVAIALLLLMIQIGPAPSTAGSLDRLRAKIAVTAVGPVSQAELAGSYTSSSKELEKRLDGPLVSGDELHLFPDGTYLYCRWVEAEPTDNRRDNRSRPDAVPVRSLTVYDKGTWSISGALVELKSDPEIAWNPRSDRKYLVFRRTSKSDEVLLMGMERDLPYFEEQAKNDPELTLLMVSKMRANQLSVSAAAKLKAKLMKDAWRPNELTRP